MVLVAIGEQKLRQYQHQGLITEQIYEEERIENRKLEPLKVLENV